METTYYCVVGNRVNGTYKGNVNLISFYSQVYYVTNEYEFPIYSSGEYKNSKFNGLKITVSKLPLENNEIAGSSRSYVLKMYTVEDSIPKLCYKNEFTCSELMNFVFLLISVWFRKKIALISGLSIDGYLLSLFSLLSFIRPVLKLYKLKYSSRFALAVSDQAENSSFTIFLIGIIAKCVLRLVNVKNM